MYVEQDGFTLETHVERMRGDKGNKMIPTQEIPEMFRSHFHWRFFRRCLTLSHTESNPKRAKS